MQSVTLHGKHIFSTQIIYIDSGFGYENKIKKYIIIIL